MTQKKKRAAAPASVVLREAGTDWLNDGAGVRRFTSENGRITASVAARTVRLERLYGQVGSTIRLGDGELEAVVSLARAWAKVSQRWHAVSRHFSGVGRPCWIYEPPNGGKQVEFDDRPHSSFEDWAGREERRDAGSDLALGGWKVVAGLVRTGSSLTPGEADVGAICELGALRAEVRRQDLLLHGRGKVVIEAGEEDFLAALLRSALPPAPHPGLCQPPPSVYPRCHCGRGR